MIRLFIYSNIAFLLTGLSINSLVHADGFDRNPSTNGATNGERLPALGRDERMPPTIPGEEVVTSTGKKVKIWSTSGPLVVGTPGVPPAPGGGSGQSVQEVIGEGNALIVDAGKDRRR